MADWLTKIIIREDQEGRCGVSFVFSESGEAFQGISENFEKAVKYALYETNVGMTLRFEGPEGSGYEFQVSDITKLKRSS